MSNFPIQVDLLSLDLVNTRFVKYHKINNLISTDTDFMEWLNEKANNNMIIKNILIPYIEQNQNEISIIRKNALSLRAFLIKGFDLAIELDDFSNFNKMLTNKINTADFKITISAESDLSIVPRVINDQFLNTLIIGELMEEISKDKMRQLKKCENHECVLYFINTTGKRKWCSMKICGNRHKSKKYNKN